MDEISPNEDATHYGEYMKWPTNIWTHEDKALNIWLKHYAACAERLEIPHDAYEREQAIDSFRECIQVKLLHDGSVKVKWEHSCWWADCNMPVFAGQYYCVMAHPKYITWKEPFDLAKEGEGIAQ